jgi:hypothetical protein
MTEMTTTVRNAIDRDIRRATAALTTWPHPNPRQRAAITEHVA